MSNTELLWFFILDYDEGWGIKRHSCEHYLMYYVFNGQGQMSIDNEPCPLVKDMCILIHPGTKHELLESESAALRLAQVQFEIHDEELKRSLQKAPTVLKSDSGAISTHLIEMNKEWQSSLPYKKKICELLQVQILYEYLRIDVKAKSTRQLFCLEVPRPDALSGLTGQVAVYAQEHCFDSFSLDAMALELNYNKNYLCKIFKNSTGHTIVGYVNCLRVARAIDLVCYTNMALSEIARISGFHDIHYFTKVFKKVTGHTPGDLRSRGKLKMGAESISSGQYPYRYFNKQKETKSTLEKD